VSGPDACAGIFNIGYLRIPAGLAATEDEMSATFPGRTIAGRGDAESVAIQVLNFIAADGDRIIPFLSVTGLQPETIRESATSSHFLLGVLKYVAKDDERLKGIAQDLKIRPTAILAAIVHLSPEPEAKPSGTTVDAAPQLPRRNLAH
jgi:hypothetical protein